MTMAKREHQARVGGGAIEAQPEECEVDDAHDFPANGQHRQGKCLGLATASRTAAHFRRSRLDRGHRSAGKPDVYPTGRSKTVSVDLCREVISRFARKD